MLSSIYDSASALHLATLKINRWMGGQIYRNTYIAFKLHKNYLRNLVNCKLRADTFLFNIYCKDLNHV